MGCPDSTIRTPARTRAPALLHGDEALQGASGRTVPTPSAIVSEALPAPDDEDAPHTVEIERAVPDPETTPVPPERLTGEAVCVPGGDPGLEDPPGPAPERGEVSHARTRGAPAGRGPAQEAGYRPGGRRWSRWPASRSTSSVFGKQKRIFVRPSSGCA